MVIIKHVIHNLKVNNAIQKYLQPSSSNALYREQYDEYLTVMVIMIIQLLFDWSLNFIKQPFPHIINIINSIKLFSKQLYNDDDH